MGNGVDDSVKKLLDAQNELTALYEKELIIRSQMQRGLLDWNDGQTRIAKLETEANVIKAKAGEPTDFSRQTPADIKRLEAIGNAQNRAELDRIMATLDDE